MVETAPLNKKWNYLRKILERSGPFQQESFEPSSEILEFLNNSCKILVIGEFITIFVNHIKSKQYLHEM